MSEKVTITIDAEDWDLLRAAARAAAKYTRQHSLDSNDEEVHHQLDQAARNYRMLADRMLLVMPGVTA